jgi:hypothetical protein
MKDAKVETIKELLDKDHVSLKEYKKFVKELDAEYSKYWLKTDATDLDELKKAYGISDLDDIFDDLASTKFGKETLSRQSRLSKLIGVAVGVIAVFPDLIDKFFQLKAFAAPDETQQIALHTLLDRYQRAIAYRETHGGAIGRQETIDAMDAFIAYLKAISADDKLIAAASAKRELFAAEGKLAD